ncbi:hypothetical protein ES705_49436 [subsurface metagenome]
MSEFDSFLVFIGVGPDGYPAGDSYGDTSFYNSVDITRQIIKGQVTMCVNQFHS